MSGTVDREAGAYQFDMSGVAGLEELGGGSAVSFVVIGPDAWISTGDGNFIKAPGGAAMFGSLEQALAPGTLLGSIPTGSLQNLPAVGQEEKNGVATTHYHVTGADSSQVALGLGPTRWSTCGSPTTAGTSSRWRWRASSRSTGPTRRSRCRSTSAASTTRRSRSRNRARRPALAATSRPTQIRHSRSGLLSGLAEFPFDSGCAADARLSLKVLRTYLSCASRGAILRPQSSERGGSMTRATRLLSLAAAAALAVAACAGSVSTTAPSEAPAVSEAPASVAPAVSEPPPSEARRVCSGGGTGRQRRGRGAR